MVVPYLVMAGVRGPDHEELLGADEWKRYVTAPLRYLIAQAFGYRASDWCCGECLDPAFVRAKASCSREFLEKAVSFSRFSPSHVVLHAQQAYEALLDQHTACEGVFQTEIATHLRWLEQQGLLGSPRLP